MKPSQTMLAQCSTLFFLFLGTQALFTLSTSNPTQQTHSKRCNSPLEDSPWQLSNLQLFYPAPVGTKNGTLSFTFHDNNTDIGLRTICNGTVSPEGECTDGYGGYVACANEEVVFQLHEGTMLMVAKEYEDPCEDPPYDGHQAFGYNYTHWVKRENKAGKRFMQTKMSVPIRDLS